MSIESKFRNWFAVEEIEGIAKYLNKPFVLRKPRKDKSR